MKVEDAFDRFEEVQTKIKGTEDGTNNQGSHVS